MYVYEEAAGVRISARIQAVLKSQHRPIFFCTTTEYVVEYVTNTDLTFFKENENNG